MTSGKLGVSIGDDDSDEDGGGRGRNRASRAVGKSKFKPGGGRQAPPTATGGVGGWLSAGGALGVPVDPESDDDGGGGGDGFGRDRPTMVSGETQTDDDIEGIVKRGEVPKLPPWAKRWTPPAEPVAEDSQHPTAESSSAAGGEPDKQVNTAWKRYVACAW